MTAAITATRNGLIHSNRGLYDRQLSRWSRLGEDAEYDEQLNTWVAYLDDILIFGSDNEALAAYGELCIIHARLNWEMPVWPQEPPSAGSLCPATPVLGSLPGYYPDGI